MTAFHKDALPHGYELQEYTIEAVLGHGGFGITYRAHDRNLQTEVAIKEYFPSELSARQDIAEVAPKQTPKAQRDYHMGLKNFVKEARALAHFKHPNIVRVLRYLETNGTAYMVMEYERGQSLADHLRLHGPRLDESALHRIFLPILNGVRAVHEADMLHLDIKPENIYLREDGTPMLIDFGSTRQAISHTMPDKFLVTHGYAPIEQYPDKGKQGPWTDIYALGASMYRCVTGKRPVNAIERYQAILTYRVDPLAPAAVAGKDHYSPQLLDAIDWALQVYPRDRPQSVREFQDRLLRKTSGATTRSTATTTRTVTATTRTTTTTSTRSTPRAATVRRRPSQQRWLLPLAFLLVAAVGGYMWYSGKFSPAESPTVPSATKSPAAPTAAGEAPVTPESATTKPATAPGTAPSAGAAQPGLLQNLEGHANGTFAVAFSANGGRLATGGADGTVRVWDSARGTLLKTLEGHARTVNAVAFSHDGRWLASASLDGSVRLWDARALASQSEWRNLGGPLYALAFSPDNKRLAVAGRARRINVLEIDSKQPVLNLAGHSDEIYALAFSPDGQWIASAGADRTVRVWNSTRAGDAASLSVHRAEVRALAFSPDGRWLAAGTMDNVIRLIETGGGTQVRTLTPARASVLALAYMPDGKRLVAGTADHRVLLVDTESGELLRSFDGGAEAVTSVTVSSDGRFIAAGNRDGRARIWQLR